MRVGLEIINTARVQFRIPRRVVEWLVEHHVHARRVRCRDKICKFTQCRVARVCFAQERVDLEKVFHRIRTADGVRIPVAVGLAVQNSNRVNRLEPQPVDAEALRVLQVETVGHRIVAARAGAVVKIGERAAVVLRRALRADGQRVQFIHRDVARLRRRDDDTMIAPPAARIPVPVRAADDFEPRGQTIRAGPRGVERERIISAAEIRHRVGLVIIIVIARKNKIAVRRHDAVLDAVAVRVERGMVATVEIGKNLHVRHRAAVRREEQRERNRVVVQLVHKNVRRGVVGIHAVDR